MLADKESVVVNIFYVSIMESFSDLANEESQRSTV